MKIATNVIVSFFNMNQIFAGFKLNIKFTGTFITRPIQWTKYVNRFKLTNMLKLVSTFIAGSSIARPCKMGVNRSCARISPHIVIPSNALSCLRKNRNFKNVFVSHEVVKH